MTPTPTNAYVGQEVAALRLQIFSIPDPLALLDVSEVAEFQQKQQSAEGGSRLPTDVE